MGPEGLGCGAGGGPLEVLPDLVCICNVDGMGAGCLGGICDMR